MKEKKPSITAVILTYNEQIHLQRCLDSLKNCVEKIYVIDSFSSDSTEDIANNNNISIIHIEWENSYSKKYNTALNTIDFKTDWVLRIDADEYLTERLATEIVQNVDKTPENVKGIFVTRTIKFMDRELKYGGMHPVYTMRLWRAGFGKCESKLMDEHIVLSEGDTINYKNCLIDDNLKGIDDWIDKHNTYSTKEAIDMLRIESDCVSSNQISKKIFGNQVNRTRKLKSYYAKNPLFIRAFIFFIYRYVFRMGFRDGIAGFCWNFLQGLWYRMLVDIKILDIKRQSKKKNVSLDIYIRDKYGFELCQKNNVRPDN